MFGHSASQGGAGTTFSVQVSDISHDPRTYKFVFGQRKIGAFLERSRGDASTSVLVAQVPRFKDTNWWSSKVPVYLLVTDSQTDENIHSVQIGEFTYQDSPTPSPLKRPRQESVSDNHHHHHLQHGSPIKRSTSQPAQQGPIPMFNPLPAPTYHSPYSQGAGQYASPGRQGQEGTTYRDGGAPIPYSSAPTLPNYESSRVAPVRDFQQSQFIPSPLSMPDPGQTRYIAEPQDVYAVPPRSAGAYSDSLSFGGGGSGSVTGSRQGRRSPTTTPASYYQSSIPSPSVNWKSPYRPVSGAAGTYTSPPPSSTLSKAEIPYDPMTSSDDTFDGNMPTLQRTSTLSSTGGSSGPMAVTPASAPAGWLPSNKAKLEVLGELDDMSRNWSADEFAIRRRLVQFWRKQEGNVVKINFRPVEPGTSRPLHAIVISCIYWEERQECFFTSVDAIFLLESLVGNKFAVEEKNRIRRNLEGFRPLTVSKGKADSEAFFKLIMGFPAPKPRNIEKDVKAFPWRILTSALRKIVGKYSASYEGLTERTTGDSGATEERDMAASTAMGSADMPPPTLVRQGTTGSGSADEYPPEAVATQMQPGQMDKVAAINVKAQGLSLSLPLPRSLAAGLSSSGIVSDTAASTVTTTTTTTSSSIVPRAASPRSGLSIHVPQPAENLPVLDGGVPASNDFERRPSALATAGGGGFPMSGLSNVDFSDFFQSPGNQPTSGSGWPSLSSLFPPPSAGLGGASGGSGGSMDSQARRH